MRTRHTYVCACSAQNCRKEEFPRCVNVLLRDRPPIIAVKKSRWEILRRRPDRHTLATLHVLLSRPAVSRPRSYVQVALNSILSPSILLNSHLLSFFGPPVVLSFALLSFPGFEWAAAATSASLPALIGKEPLSLDVNRRRRECYMSE